MLHAIVFIAATYAMIGRNYIHKLFAAALCMKLMTEISVGMFISFGFTPGSTVPPVTKITCFK